jgi:hypothetical protein
VRLKRYLLTEEHSPEEVTEMVRKNCSEALDAMSRTHNALWRGSDEEFSGYIKELAPRTDRRPRDTKRWVHDLFDDAFEKKFGWRVRSEAIFATAAKNVADGFGNRAYLFFPFDGFKIIWSSEVDDLTNKLGVLNYDIKKIQDDPTTIKTYSRDEYVEMTKPDLKTGKGPGHWEVPEFPSFRVFLDYKEMKKHYGPITITNTRQVGPYFYIDFTVDNASSAHNKIAEKNKSGIWTPALSSSDKQKLVDITHKKIQDKVKEKVEDLVSTYKEGNIDKAIYSMNELSFKCSKYYLVDDKMWDKGFFAIIRGYDR